MSKKNFYLVSYDISDQKRLQRVHKFLKDFGAWKQRSVFECWLTKEEYRKLKEGLKEIIKPREDRVRFYQICENCRKQAFYYGWGEIPERYEEDVVF
ncbi:MAG: CRISPR-associated endonuclease Cas2 [Thermodesulfobacteria bacterium]|nr:CRISPR-associated endonuclease Cas2 [Thermodesulfobacteriota bacterium]